LRYHEQFKPSGTNVNSVQVVNNKQLLVRTYERGVEDETFACGTGCCASVVIAHHLNLADTNVHTKTHGGFYLSIELINGIPFLRGPVELVFEGTLTV
jgi:diaminopimelate epimerase